MRLVKGMSMEELGFKIEDEGFDYFFNYYISAKDILDNELGVAVEGMQTYREKVIDILKRHGIIV